jgi:hypothetical protein
MGVLSCEPTWEEEARFEQTSREWREWYTVYCASATDGPREIFMGRPGLTPYSPHPQDPQALVAEWFPHRLERGTNVWLLELRYSTEVDVTQNPLSMPPVITIESQIREVPTLVDANNNPITNTAGFLMTDPPPTRKLVDKIFKCQKNVPLNLPDWTDTHPGTVNTDSVTIRGRTYDPGTLWFAAIGIGEEQNVPGSTDTISTLRANPYTSVDFELWWRRDGWVELYPNRGWYELVPKTGPKKFSNVEIEGGTIKAQNVRAQFRKLPPYQVRRCLVGPLQEFPPEPVYLDVNGQMIVNPTPADVILIAYDGYDKQTFTGVLPLK